MIRAIADTHAALWYLYSDPRLGSLASEFIDSAVQSGNQIGLSAISLAEIVYLVERARIPSGALEEVRRALADPASVLQEMPLDGEIAATMSRIAREDIPDLPDRVIAATALFLGVPVLSRDRRIRTSAIEAIW